MKSDQRRETQPGSSTKTAESPRRRWLKAGAGLGVGLGAAGMAPVVRGQGDRYAKYRGQTIVINYPAHPHYDQAEKLFAEFTKETGIKVERDKMQYLRMKDKQVLEMSKPKGDYDVITYVVMWKTEYVAKNFLEPLDTYFANKALADPGYELKDLITAYYENISLVGGSRCASIRHSVRGRNRGSRLSPRHPRQTQPQGAGNL
jgi:multiple sugar transport system substrate-binding protein